MLKLTWAFLALVIANLSGVAFNFASATENDPLIRQIAPENAVDRSKMLKLRQYSGKLGIRQTPCSENSAPPCINMMQRTQLAMNTSPPAVETVIPYESRGIGEADPVAEMAANYNLHMVFATRGSGEYLADVKVRIDDAKGKLILDANSPGPIFFARLPAGTYRVTASLGNKSQRKSVSVQDGRLRDLYFYWTPKNLDGAGM